MPKNRKIKNKKEKTADTVSIGGGSKILALEYNEGLSKSR